MTGVPTIAWKAGVLQDAVDPLLSSSEIMKS
jgi:hypothetical protein